MSDWVVLKQPNCIYCKRALDLLKEVGENNVTTFDISEKPDLKAFMVSSGLTTVPQIYRNGHKVGGFSDLQEFFGPGVSDE